MSEKILGFVNFDKPSNKNNIIEALVLKEKVKTLRQNKFIKIENAFGGKEFFVGRIIEGPFFQPEEVERNSALAQVAILHGDEFPAPPNYYASYSVEIIGIWNGNRIVHAGTRPTPQSKIYALDNKEINDILGLTQGDMVIGNLDGYPDILVKINSRKISVLPRNVGIFGTVGSGKTNTAQVLIEELAAKNWAVIVLDVEGEYTLMDEENDVVHETAELKRFAKKPVGIKKFFVAKLSNQESVAEKASEVTIRVDQIDPNVLSEILGATEPQAAALVSIIEGLRGKSETRRDEVEGDFITPGLKESGYTLQEIVTTIDAYSKKPDELGVSGVSLRPLRRKLNTLQKTGAFDDPSASNIVPGDFMKPGVVTIFDLSMTGDYEKNMLTAQLLNRIFKAKLKDKENKLPPTMIVIEEAHTFISRENKQRMYETMRMLKEIARRGRKRWLALTFISQQPSHIPNEIFELSNTRVVHNIRSSKNLEVLKSSSGDVSEEVWNSVPNLDVGRAVINGPQFRRHSPIVKIRFPQTKRRKNE